MGSFTYVAQGNREDLIDIITNIAPDDAPLLNRFGRATAKAMTHAWLTDSIATPGANKHLEDAEFVVASATPRVRLSNYIQIFMRGYFTTDSQEEVLKAGITSELAYQMGKCSKEIARDVEYALINNSTQTQGDGTNAGQMGGIPFFNVNNNVDMASSALTEAKFNDAIQNAWNKGGNPEIVVCSGKQKRVISGFTAGAQKTRAQKETTLTNVVEVYQSDFGLVKMMAHRLQPDARLDILELQYWKVAYLKPFATESLPRTGLKNAKIITGQLTLECRTKDAHAAIINVG